MAWRDELKKLVTGGEVRLDEPMQEHTSFRIGGPADALVVPAVIGELHDVIEFAAAHGLPWFILGRGTNLLVKDGGIRGLVIKTGLCLRELRNQGCEVWAGAGMTLAELANEAARLALSGLAFAAGIPGTLGGGVCMNAGAYGGELSQVVKNVTAYYPGQGERTWTGGDLALGYRSSRFQRESAVIESVCLRLVPGDERTNREEMACYAKRRQERQPLTLPSAGSVFRRPPGGYAGTLIEEAGLKGRRFGQAQVSEKHANFIVNLGGARAAEVIALMEMVQCEVQARTGVLLEPEIRIIGEDGS